MISKKIKNLKIATILPYKENYTFENASAASLWVAEFFKKSKFRDKNFIYGNTKSKNFLTKNYININLNSLNSKLKSSTKEYSSKLIKELYKKKFDIIEIHNRPLILFNLVNEINASFILYFHNDPLSMKGSKKISERLSLLHNSEKIIFVSEWVRNRFFSDLDKKLNTKTEVIYPSVNKQLPVKKNKFILFVGRLNQSKGYDIFAKVIIRILDEFPRWKAFSLGDEDRRDIYIDHPNHKELGFLNHKKTLNLLNRSEIAVVPSRWDEPFGRTALEATSRGCATIVSNKGGLLETTDYGIVLKKVDEISLYKDIKKLITENKFRNKIKILSRKNVKHLISNNTKVIDHMRENIFPKYNLNILKNKLKIVNLYNQGQKLNHRLYNISVGKKFTNGFIRNNHDVLEISDRDYLKNNKTLNIFPNRKNFQKYLIETFKNYNPDFLFFGHTKNINIDTLEQFKIINDSIIISQWNEDPVMPSLNYSKANLKNIMHYSDFVDHNFLTTHPSVVNKDKIIIKNLHFFFVPVDKNIECFDTYKLNPLKDIFYAMSHGVNRANLKKGKIDSRLVFLNSLVKKMTSVKYDFYGFENKEPIWGNDFYKSLVNSKMGLNLSRGLPTKYYSSNRIASLVGNGLMTFVDRKTQLNDFFNNNEIIFYNDVNDLNDKINFYKNNDKARINVAKNGKKKYFKLFNEKITTKYIVDKSFGLNNNN